MIKGILFDMDGVLLDTERIYIEADRAAAAMQGKDYSHELYLLLAGANDLVVRQKIEERFGPGFSYAAFRAASNRRVEEIISAGGLKTKPGLRRLLKWLKARGMKAAVATSNNEAEARRLLGLAGIYEAFDAVISGDMIGPSKPAPDIFLAAAAALGLPPGQCVAVEDSHHGLRSAHAAGCVTVMVPDGLPPTEEIRALCAAVLPSLARLPAFIESLESEESAAAKYSPKIPEK